MTQSWLVFDLIPAGLVFALGLALGSFLNVVIHRLPRRQSLLRPGSHCPTCRSPVRPWHNIPLLGWFLLRGRCADCGARISVRYPLIELAGGALALLAIYGFPTPLRSVVAVWFFFSLLAILFIDLEHRIIPDEISLVGAAIGLAVSPWTIGIASSAAGLAAGAAGLYATGWLYERTRKRAGMGLGDVKLAAMLGAFLGLPGVVLSVLLASVGGSILGLSLIVARKATRATALPFGSILAPAAAVALLWGPQILGWYSQFVVRP